MRAQLRRAATHWALAALAGVLFIFAAPIVAHPPTVPPDVRVVVVTTP